MYLTAIAHYYPSHVLPNHHFAALYDVTSDWLETRTGIRERRKAGPDENTQTMAIQALGQLKQSAASDLSQVDLVVAATYSPHDTVATLGHALQHHLPVGEIPVVTISSACSSFLNALEIVQGYFAMGKAQHALVAVSEHNTRYANEKDHKSGHLWGDGAAVVLVTRQRPAQPALHLIDLVTAGAAHVGKNLEGVKLVPAAEGISMPNGRDVFIYATQYMGRISQQLLHKHHKEVKELRFFIPHQANLRISRKVAEDLDLPMDKVVSNIQYLGNTGCAGCAIALSEVWTQLAPDDLIALSVFGGGYSYGAALLEMQA
jgi:3-oxoacyl-[acyl-carrier-protein] synthase III